MTKNTEISAASIIAKVARDRLITKCQKYKKMPGIKMQDMEQTTFKGKKIWNN